MKLKLSVIMALLGAARGSETCDQQTGLFYNDDATSGYTLFSPIRGIGTYLVDTDGGVVQSWMDPDGLTPGTSSYVSKAGTLLKAVRTKGRAGFGERIREYAKDGTCIFEFRYDTETGAPGLLHHDLYEMPSGNLLVAAREGKEDTILEIKREGKLNPNWNAQVETPDTGLTMDPDNTCQFVLDGADADFQPEWKWSSADHRGTGPYKLSTETIATVNFNHIDYFPDRGHILLSCNTCNELYIIDYNPTSGSGDLLWRWGSVGNYGVAGDQLLSFNHGAHWVYDNDVYGWSGFQAADIGDVIVFNNRDPQLGTGRSGYSSVVELSPPWDAAAGNYGLPGDGEAFGPSDMKSYYDSFTHDGVTYQMDSDATGNAQLLPNGRMMMVMGTANNNPTTGFAEGDLYELKPDASGNVASVWRYVNPFIPPQEFWPFNNGPKNQDVELHKCEIVEKCDEAGFGTDCNIVFRGTKYAPNFAGVAALGISGDGGKTSYMAGDPHIRTWSGGKYDFHGQCDLVLLSDPDYNNGQGLTIHVRTKIERWWSYIESAAVSIGGNVLEVKGGISDTDFWVNGVEGKITRTDHRFMVGDVHTRFRKLKRNVQYKMELVNGQTITIRSIKHMLRVEIEHSQDKDFSKSAGLLGSYAEGALIGREGTLFTDPNKFGNEWQVRDTEAQLFHNEQAPQYPEKCIMPTATHHLRPASTMVSKEKAKAACSDLTGDEKDNCIFDVMATGDVSLFKQEKTASATK